MEEFCIVIEAKPRVDGLVDTVLHLVKCQKQPVLAPSIEGAVALAEAYKREHPEFALTIRTYLGRCRCAGELAQYGAYRAGAEILRTV